MHLSKGFLQRCKGAAQTGTSPALVVFWPEQRRQGVTAVASPGNSQVDEEGDGLAAIKLNWLSVAFNSWWSKQKQRQMRHVCQSF
jgi:hypothetical protein